VLVWPFWVLWGGAVVMTALAPIGVAGAIGRANEARATRIAAGRRIWVPAVGLNVVLAALALVAFVAIL
jgi:hypothetical protein